MSHSVVDPRPSRYRGRWFWILGLIGLDYFSTLAYQPSIAFQAAGRLAPLATLTVILATLLGALPVYLYVAARSPSGRGAIGLLERQIHGWRGKLLVLVLLGFAATDFIFTRTLSVADAAVHLIHNPNPHWRRVLDLCFAAGSAARPLLPSSFHQAASAMWNEQTVVTLLLLLLGFVFWAVFRKGFTRRIVYLAALVVGVYLALSAFVVASGLRFLANNPQFVQRWFEDIRNGRWQPSDVPAYEGWGMIAMVCVVLLPKLALGLSGFEMSMVIMPLVPQGEQSAASDSRTRVRRTWSLLILAALVMAAFLLGSTFVSTLLIPPSQFSAGGQAANRALAYLAHGGTLEGGASGTALGPFFGEGFGTLYDLSTILILCLAGASVTIGLRDLVPPYLHRLGMELHWAHVVGAVLQVFNLIKLAVTVFFHADVNAQRGAYASSVLVLITSASAASMLDLSRNSTRVHRHGRALARWWFMGVSFLFGVTTLAVIIARPEGFLMALALIGAMLFVSMASRMMRQTELRFESFQFADETSRLLWQAMEDMEIPVLVPHCPGRLDLTRKEEAIRARHRLTPDVPIVFIEAELGDPSEFYQSPVMSIYQEKGRFSIRITRCVSIAHAIAAAALELSRTGQPPEIHFGWSDERPLSANLNFVLFGQGNVPWMVRELIRKAEPRPERQPRIVIG